MKKIILILMLFPLLTHISEVKADKKNLKNQQQKAILVTGASSGIGRTIAETLASSGYFVYAGARKKSDILALSAIKNIQGIRLDVTQQIEIDAAVETIKKAGKGLYGLVNNAGVAVFEPLIEITEKEMHFLMDVNLFGPYRINRAFAPLIIESKGRITTIGSISGIMSGAMLGPYSMSKHAVEALTDALAKEMKKFDVQVSVIEPGNYNSKVISSMRKRMQANGYNINHSLYKKEMQGLLNYFTADRSQHKNPNDVAKAVIHALFNEKPKQRYMVVPNQKEAEMTIKAAIKKVAQLNAEHLYSYDRKTLVLMLDEALKTK